MVTAHYCDTHKSKYYRNEKVDSNGRLSVWYSHKLANGGGFCTEKVEDQEVLTQQMIPFSKELSNASKDSNSQRMLMCNAMNNAVALAANDKIKLDQIGQYYQRILSEFNQTLD